jgi:hypothetical protein
MHSDFVAALLGREVRTSTPTIKQFRVPRGSSFDLVPEGTIGLAVSNDKQVLRNLGDAIGGADFTSAAKTAGKLQARQRRLLLRDRRVVASLTDVPNFGELRYSGTPLVQGVFLAGRVPLVVSTIMYSGAQLDPQRFEFVEKFRRPATADDAMFALVMVREPELSPLESRVLANVQASSVDQVFHPGGSAFFTPVVGMVTPHIYQIGPIGDDAVAFRLVNDAYCDFNIAGWPDDLAARAEYETALAGRSFARLNPDQAVGELLRLRMNALVATRR